MRFAVISLLALAGLGLQMAASPKPEETASPGQPSAAPPPPAAQTIATRQTVFAIPFTIERPTLPSEEPSEVQLYVSVDRSATWQLCGRVAPSQGQFLFRAARDGEYRFAIRTLDRSGQFRAQSNAAGLHVVVDTVPPKVQLAAERGSAGQITARWSIDEPYLKLDTFRIQYRTGPDQPWQSVAVSPEKQTVSGTVSTSEVTWLPESKTGQTQIRAEVADAAGNPAVNFAQVDLGAAVPASAPQAEASAESPWRGAAEHAAVPWPAQNDQPQRKLVAVQRAATDPAAAPAETQQVRAAMTTATGPTPSPDSLAAAAPKSASTTQPRAEPRPADGPEPRVEQLKADPTIGMVAKVNPPIQRQYVPPTPAPLETAAEQPTPQPTPRMINRRLFELEYDDAAGGPKGFTRVELWGSQDGGRSWRSFALDDDNRSPLLVSIDREGVFGFIVAAATAPNAAPDPPAPGTPPEIFIGVDLTKPVARITSVEPATEGAAGNVVILWKAEDLALGPRPVSLAFSTRPTGPWTPIASGLENTGRYQWTVAPNVPDGIFLRLEVHDAAGNIGIFDTQEPVAVQAVRSSVRIRDVRPLGQEYRQTSRPLTVQ